MPEPYTETVTSVRDFISRLFGPAPRPEPLPAALAAWFDRCEHGAQFLDECLACPDGCPVIGDERPGGDAA